jgi:hypothetical protein
VVHDEYANPRRAKESTVELSGRGFFGSRGVVITRRRFRVDSKLFVAAAGEDDAIGRVTTAGAEADFTSSLEGGAWDI